MLDVADEAAAAGILSRRRPKLTFKRSVVISPPHLHSEQTYSRMTARNLRLSVEVS